MKKSTDYEIYADYLVALILRKPMWTVQKMHKCSRKHIYNVRDRIEAQQKYSLGEHARKDIYEHKYKPMVQLKHSVALQNAIIRDMYLVSGFSLWEIAKWTGWSEKTVRNVVISICG